MEMNNKISPQIESELRRYKTLVDTANAVIMAHDDEWRVTIMNSYACKLLGYEEGEMIGEDIRQLLEESEFKRAEPVRRKVKIDPDKSVGGFEQYLWKKGKKERVLISWNVSAVKDSKGKLIGIQGVGQDITERKKIQEILKSSEEKWRSLVENAPNIIMIVTRDGTIEFINRTVSGIRTEEAAGRKLYDYIEDKYHDIVEKTIERVFKSGTIDSYKIKGMGPNNTISWYETQVGPIKHAGKVTGVILITADITGRRKAEEKLKASEKKLQAQKKALQEKTIALRELLEQVSFEKRQIQENISTNIEKLLLPHVRKLKKKRTRADKKYLELMEKDIGKLASSFGRKISEKQLKLSPREIEISDMISGGLSSKEIAKILNISRGTVDRHREKIRRKLNLTNRKTNLASFLQNL